MQDARQEFWGKLNRKISERTDTPLSTIERTNSNKGNYRKQPNIAAATGIGFNVRFDNQMMVYLIPRNIDTRDEVFEFLGNYKMEINEKFDDVLEWRPPDQSTKIVLRWDGADVQDQQSWEEYISWMIEKGEQFDTVFGPYLRKFESRRLGE